MVEVVFNIIFIIVFNTLLFFNSREHDKGPDLFFHVLYQLADQSLHFKVSVIGQTFTEVPGMTSHKA